MSLISKPIMRAGILLATCSLALFLTHSFFSTQVISQAGKLQYANTDSWWWHFDLAAFKTLNSTIDNSSLWCWIWGLSNHRLFDLVPAVCMMIIFTCWFWRRRDLSPEFKMARGLCLVCILVSSVILAHLIYSQKRLSPTLTTEVNTQMQVTLLTQQNLPFATKDSSKSSFPSDHGIVLFVTGGTICAFCGWPYALPSLFLMLTLCLPRIGGGGHWASDFVAGALPLSLTWLALWLCTPLADLTTRRFEPLGGHLWRLTPSFLRKGLTGKA